MIELIFSRKDDNQRGGWNVQFGELYDECLTGGEALEVFIAVSRGEKPYYLRTQKQWDAWNRRHEKRMQEIDEAKK